VVSNKKFVFAQTRREKVKADFYLEWIQKDIYFTVTIKLFDRRNNLMKTQTSHSLKNSHGTVWYAEKEPVMAN